MENQFERTELLLGKDAIQKLKNAHVAVFGVGGVGGFVVEALVRSGVGEIDVIDKDTVSLSNINRQIIALHSTVGQPKVEVIKNRALDINPNVKINTFETFFLPDTADMFDFSKYDYVVDAIDTVKGKIEIILRAEKAGVKLSALWVLENKLDPTLLKFRIFTKRPYALWRALCAELKARGIKKLKVVYSKEGAIKIPAPDGERPVPEVLRLYRQLRD